MEFSVKKEHLGQNPCRYAAHLTSSLFTITYSLPFILPRYQPVTPCFLTR